MDKAEFTQRVLQAETTMYRVAKSILMNDCDCEDAVQEAILRGYAKLYTLRQEAYFQTWLIRILIHECYRILRTKTATIEYDTELISVIKENQDYFDLYQAIVALPLKVRVVIVLLYIEDYSVADIAKILKIPQGTVKSRLARGRELLKKYFTENEVYCYAKI